MMLGIRYVLNVFLLLVLVAGYSIEGRLDLPKFTLEESYGTHLELTDLKSSSHETWQGHITQNGTFKFNELPLGSYLLDIDTLNYVLDYPSVRINIAKQLVKQEDGTENEEIITSAYEYQLGHATDDTPNAVDYPLVISVHAKEPEKRYYEAKDKGLAATGQLDMLLSSPLLLAGIVAVLAMVAMPYVVEKLDPETALKMKGEQPEEAAAAALLKEQFAKQIASPQTTKASGANKNTTKATKRKN